MLRRKFLQHGSWCIDETMLIIRLMNDEEISITINQSKKMKKIGRIGFRVVSVYEVEECEVPDHVYESFKKLEEMGVDEISNFSSDDDECRVYDYIMRNYDSPHESITCEIKLDEISLDENY